MNGDSLLTMVALFFVYGLAFFVMGFAILGKMRWAGRSKLAANLLFLALFGEFLPGAEEDEEGEVAEPQLVPAPGARWRQLTPLAATAPDYRSRPCKGGSGAIS
ncbi:MAG: hypothetical protein QGG56_07290 [Dehalococcoidia bacterium]|jgi:hypothetical protein|nr:hypothetical protein [Dehalococcoidia bacterium]